MKHMNAKHIQNSTLAGMAEASQLHTFIRHPNLSGMFKAVHDCSYKVLNIYEPIHVHLLAHSFGTLSHNLRHLTHLSPAPILGTPSMAG
jgi:hypothetical protein